MCGRFRQERSNVEPGREAMVLTAEGQRRLPFGYRAPWQWDAARPLINARAETVAVKPAWRSAAVATRCAVEVDSWTERGWVHRVERGATVWLAGLWWPTGFVVLTMASCAMLARAHHRQPAFAADPRRWLEAATVAAALEALQAVPPQRVAVLAP